MLKRKILFIIPTFSLGGVEISLLNLINSLNKEEYEIHLMAISDNTGMKISIPEGVHTFYLFKKPSIFGKTIRGVSYAYSLIFKLLPPKIIHKIFIKNNYDIEVAYHGWFGLKLVSGADSNTTKTFSWIHSDVSKLKNPKHINWVPFRNKNDVLDAYLKMNNIICVSEKSKDLFIDSYSISKKDAQKVIVRYNVLPFEEIIEKSKENISLNKKTNTFLICAVGRLDEGKGFERLIKGCKILIDKGLNIEVWIIGEGAQRDFLEDLISELSLEKRVKLLGACPNPYKYMIHSDLFVNASYSESYSLVVAEAVILGIPVLSTDTTGVREILGHSKYGYIVPNEDNELYDGLYKLTVDVDFYNLYKESVKKRSTFFKTQKYEILIKELLDSGTNSKSKKTLN